ncbi:MAG: formate dehydrogenase subunit alpha [Thermodesulfovibrionales bacterium]|nr:formate dehydrogenase subunit alpha [Thermodesulfovibrionales bacterium]
MEKISIKINDQDIMAHKGATILETALANKIYIPHLCYHPDLKPAGSCRVCLVELDDGKLVTSCRTPVKEEMVIKTKSAELDKVRRPIIEMIIANHHMDCKNCAKKGRCELQRIMGYMKIDKKRIQQNLRFPKEELPLDDSNPFFIRDHNKCVLCGICVRTCQEIQKVSAIDFAGRGYSTKIATLGDKPIAQSRCESCGECVVRCPVGALVPKNLRRPSHEVKTICPYCGVGCSIVLGIRDNVVVNVRGDADSSVNSGRLCVKGRFGLSFVNSQDRLTSPLIRISSNKNSSLVTRHPSLFREVSWDEALDLVASKLKNYRGDEFALIASTKCTNEESYIAQKFARVVMGTNNIDSSVRLCDAPSITALLKTNGINALTNSISEIENAASILIVGANITQSHPVIGLRVKKAVENGAILIVVSPIEIDLCGFAKVWLRPYPGTDLALFMGMCKAILDGELHDNAFIQEKCENFEDFKNSLDDFPSGKVERITGVSRDKVASAAKIFATNKPSAILWSSGLTQYSHGTDNVLGLINLSMLTGNITKPSYGINPLMDHNNSQGVCDMGCLPDFYPGYQAVDQPEMRKRFKSIWGKDLNPNPGLTLTGILQDTLEGKIKAFYIMGSDPVSNIAGSHKVKEALKKAEFIIFQDIFLNDTAQFADVILPAASFAEKDGTFTNTETRVQIINKAMEPIGNSRPDWEIICNLAERMGSRGFDFNNPEDIMSEIASVTPIYRNISYNSLRKGSLKWSDLAETSLTGQNGKYKFTPLQYRPPAEVPDVDYPLILIAERDIYSDGILSQKVDGLKALRAKRLVYINPKDATDFEIKNGEVVRVISRWGEIEGQAVVTTASPPGLVTMYLLEKEINQLINPSPDPAAKTLETKICAVRIVPQKES